MRKNPVYDWVYTSQAEPLATLAKSSSARKSGGSSSGTGDTGVLPNRAAAGVVVSMGGESFLRDSLVPCAKSLESVATAAGPLHTPRSESSAAEQPDQPRRQRSERQRQPGEGFSEPGRYTGQAQRPAVERDDRRHSCWLSRGSDAANASSQLHSYGSTCSR